MNFNKLTVKAQEAVAEAQNLSRGAGNPEMTPEHLLLALLRQEGGIVTPILNKLGLQPAQIEAELAGGGAEDSKGGGGSAGPPDSSLPGEGVRGAGAAGPPGKRQVGRTG